jgi:hypothetical protein
VEEEGGRRKGEGGREGGRGRGKRGREKGEGERMEEAFPTNPY